MPLSGCEPVIHFSIPSILRLSIFPFHLRIKMKRHLLFFFVVEMNSNGFTTSDEDITGAVYSVVLLGYILPLLTQC